MYALGQKYHFLLGQRNTLIASFARLNVKDEYFAQSIRPKIECIKMVADVTEWLSMKYKVNKQDSFDLHFYDDEELDCKHKTPSWISVYKVAKKSITMKLAVVGHSPFRCS